MAREALNKLILAAEYLVDGRSIAWVAREFGFTNPQVSNLTGLLGLQGKRSSPGTKSLDKYDQVEQAILEGWPVGEMEKTFGVHRHTIDRWFPDRPKMSPEEVGVLAELYRQNREALRRAKERGKWADIFDGGTG